MRIFFRLLKWFFMLLITVVLLVVAFVWWGSGATWPTEDYRQIRTFSGPSAEGGDTLRIMTYNIGWMSGMTNNLAVPRTEALFRENFRHFLHVIDSLRPDIIAVQEIDFDAFRSFRWQQVDSIAVHAGFPYVAQAVNWDKRYVPFPGKNPRLHFRHTISGQAIFSRYPISGHHAVVMPRPPGPHPLYNYFYIDRLAQVARIEIDSSLAFHMINVHLEAWDVSIRKLQGLITAQITDSLLALGPVLTVGDFNDMPPTLEALEAGVADSTLIPMLSLEVMKPAGWSIESPQENWHSTYSSRNPEKAIDQVFYHTETWQLVSVRGVHEMGEVSDHLPLLVELVRIRP